MTKLSFITFDEKLEAAWGLHKIEKAVLEKEIAELRERLAEADEANRRVSDENEKLREALIEECQSSEKENRRKRAYYNEVIAAEKVISELRAENEKLREALKPFAYNYQDNGLSHSMFIFEMKDLLAAKKALGDTDE